MTAATLTAPLDVLKTRLQSDFYQAQLRASRAALAQSHAHMNPLRASLFHLNETLQILGAVRKNEGYRALFKGLGPNLVGVIPARSINFYVYGNGKRIISEYGNGGREAAWVHLTAGLIAGIATSTATNPIWLVKTRLQLDKKVASEGTSGGRQYRNSLDCIRQVMRDEGLRGFFKGMSASYLGASESTLQWVLYEQMKSSLRRREERIAASGRDKNWWDHTVEHTGKAGAAGGAKLVAAILAYPHEVGLFLSCPVAAERRWSADWRCDVCLGRENTVATGAAGGRPAEVYGLDAVFQACVEGRGHDRPVRRADASPAEDGTECCHHVWHVRSDPSIV